MPFLLIYEPLSAGHRMQHVLRIAKKGLTLGHEVELATFASSLNHPAYIAMQDECGGAIRTSVLPQEGNSSHSSNSANFAPSSASSTFKYPNVMVQCYKSVNQIKRQFLYYRIFAEHFHELPRVRRPDIVFVPYLRYCALGAAILGSPFGETPWGGLFTNYPWFHLDKMGIVGPDSRSHFLQERMFFYLLRNRTLRSLFTLDETLVEYVRRTKPSLVQKLEYVPDPGDFSGTVTREEARKALGISNEVVLLLVYGTLSRRKGIDALLKATQEPGFPTQVNILFAGKQTAKVMALLASPQARILRKASRLHELNTYLSHEEERLVFKASDVVWLGYRSSHHGASGVLIQAGMTGLPVIACDEGLIGWLTEKNNLGVVVSPGNSRGVAEAIAKLVRQPELRTLYGERGQQVFAHHTSDNFAHSILHKLGLTPVPSRG